MAAALASSCLHLSAARQLLKSPAFAYPKKQNLKVGIRVRAASKGKDDGSVEDPSIPQWAQPGSEEPPPWAREETQKESSSGVEVPFYAYLIASSITAIAAVLYLHSFFLALELNQDCSFLELEFYPDLYRLGQFLST